MTERDAHDPAICRVVVNHEGQYAIWPAWRELPHGWSAGGPSGSRAECRAHVEAAWTDMRPLSLREAIAGAGRSRTPCA